MKPKKSTLVSFKFNLKYLQGRLYNLSLEIEFIIRQLAFH